MPSEERQQPRSTRTLAQKILIATCILVAVLVIALMNVGAKLSDKDVAQADLVKNPAATLKTLHDNPYSVLVAQKWLRLDYTFIVVYVIAALLAPASLRLSGLRALVGYAAVAAVIGGAACDIREDLTVGAAYRGGGLALSAHIQTLTSWKFILVFFGMGLLIFLAAVKDKPIGE